MTLVEHHGGHLHHSWELSQGVIIGNIISAVSTAGSESYIKIVYTDTNVIDFFSSWMKSHSKNPVNDMGKKCLFIADVSNWSTLIHSAQLVSISKHKGDWFGNKIRGAYEAKISTESIDTFKCPDDLVAKIQSHNRDKKLNEVLNVEK